MKREAQWPQVLAISDPFYDLHERSGERSAGNSNSWCDRGAVPTAEELARVAADYAPGVGNEAPDRMWGPWADRLDVRDPNDRRLLLYAVANACFVVPDDDLFLMVIGYSGSTN